MYAKKLLQNNKRGAGGATKIKRGFVRKWFNNFCDLFINNPDYFADYIEKHIFEPLRKGSTREAFNALVPKLQAPR